MTKLCFLLQKEKHGVFIP
ncbi:hypothetical protein QN277_024784 [Acacia crassicarpa]|uniref:Uncharacterized protein n=1 Tax=Acacia crassicarpa TaxID=499986 RepID=A0AAE1JHG4_9FABA|nr:hypothetical protein QN277_024784 [Acacia crassicarpa]